MIIYIIVVLVHPLQAYARILEHLNKTEFEREELRMAPAGVPFVKETYSLLVAMPLIRQGKIMPRF